MGQTIVTEISINQHTNRIYIYIYNIEIIYFLYYSFCYHILWFRNLKIFLHVSFDVINKFELTWITEI